ncbi:Uncharacterised protein [Mycobacterium tuberculosis]|nr:Uncharacterised protein [Mycobacterium tuberculosis]
MCREFPSRIGHFVARVVMPVAERVDVGLPALRRCHFVVAEQRRVQGIDDVGRIGAAYQYRHRGVPVSERVDPHQVGEQPPLQVDIGHLRGRHRRQPLSGRCDPQTATG